MQQPATHPKAGNWPAGFPATLGVNIAPETTDEQIKSWARMQTVYDFHVVENMLLLERRVVQLEAKLKAIERAGSYPVHLANVEKR